MNFFSQPSNEDYPQPSVYMEVTQALVDNSQDGSILNSGADIENEIDIADGTFTNAVSIIKKKHLARIRKKTYQGLKQGKNLCLNEVLILEYLRCD